MVIVFVNLLNMVIMLRLCLYVDILGPPLSSLCVCAALFRTIARSGHKIRSKMNREESDARLFATLAVLYSDGPYT